MNKLRLACLVALLLFCQFALALRDPTRPPGYEGADELGINGLVVNSIIFSPARQIATVNGQPVSVGDELNNAKVIAIHKDYVTFTDLATKKDFQVPVFYGIIKELATQNDGQTE